MNSQQDTSADYAPIAAALRVRANQVQAAVELFAAGNTVPFVARYRKETTGSLDEEQLRQIQSQWDQWQALQKRRASILETIAAQDKLSPDLQAALLAADSLALLEDLYLPYKPKRRTRATMARDAGLEPLANLILAQEPGRGTAESLAAPYINEAAPDAEAALGGARDIVAETIADHAAVRQAVREKALQWATLRSQKIDKTPDEKRIYELYYDYANRVDRLRPHQVLAINRGESEKVLRVAVEIDERDWLLSVRRVFRPDQRSPFAEQLQSAIEDSAQRLLLPAIARDVRRSLTETAEAHAIALFGKNLRGLLSQPPIAGHTIIAIDPAYRTGCKLAVIDPTGKLLATETIYPHPPQKRRAEALQTLGTLVDRWGVTLIAIGNGTASRETEQLVADLTRERDELHYLIVSEAGASVYSASPLARAELPELDVSLRGGVSIGRRVLDPLAELVKIDPRSIGVGLYQHDVNQKQLNDSLESVVESVVNQVGVDLNSASPALLAHVSGIGPSLAAGIVAYRDEHGRFPDRQTLLNVSGLGSKAFEQSAGFLRVRDGRQPLDASAIHPESYKAAAALLKRAGLTPASSIPEREAALGAVQATPELAQELGIGLPTLNDILEQLLRPGRDPREDLPAPLLRQDVLSMDDLKDGMSLEGTVRNVVDFGAFVDIGVKQDGLLHRSQIPAQANLQVGQIITVVIMSVDQGRGRISLGWDGAEAA